MEIRTATMNDLDAVAAVEAECFPVAEAATKEEFAERIKYYGDHFWLMFEGDKLIAFLDGFVTDEPDLTDEMYAKASMHDENGAWQMLFGLNTLPEYRKNGYAGELLHRAVEDARKQGRKGAVLTCKQRLVDYYAKFCFVDEGVTDKSVHHILDPGVGQHVLLGDLGGIAHQAKDVVVGTADQRDRQALMLEVIDNAVQFSLGSTFFGGNDHLGTSF